MSTESRRQFLERMLAASTATAFSSIASPAFAAEKSPNEKLGVACVGVKGRGGSHIAAFGGKNDTEILYVVDVDESIGARVAKGIAEGMQKGREPTYVQDIRKALEDPRVDIVTIATPNHWHALHAIWAMQAGKDVYVEKPVSHNVMEGRRAVEAARKYKRICQTGTQSRSNPGMIAAMKFIHEGKLGKVNVARGLCYKGRSSIGAAGKYPVPKGINYDLWLGPAPLLDYVPRPKLHYDWHWQWAYGCGDMGNQGIHQMDLCRWALGAKQLCNSVFSYGGRLGYEDAGETPNTQVAVLDYGESSLVFEVRGLKTDRFRNAGVGIIIEGTDADLVMSSYSDGAAYDKKGAEIAKFSGGGDDHHFKNFIQAVRSRDSNHLNADIEQGHLSSALCHLANISYRLGEKMSLNESLARVKDVKTTDNMAETFERTVKHLTANKVDLAKTNLTVGPVLPFDGKNEVFRANSKADAMLTREYRKPYEVPSAGQV